MLTIPTAIMLLAVIGWGACGIAILQTCEPSWTAPQALYFLVNTVTTVGIGDVPVSCSPKIVH